MTKDEQEYGDAYFEAMRGLIDANHYIALHANIKGELHLTAPEVEKLKDIIDYTKVKRKVKKL